MTNAPTPAGKKQFSGTAVLVVVGLISAIMCALVIVFSQRDVNRAMDERSEEPVTYESATQPEAAANPIEDYELGWWRCELPLPGHDQLDMIWPSVTFALWLPEDNDERSAYIRNGDEFIPVDAQWDGQTLEIWFPWYDSKIEASARGLEPGNLQGIWWKQRPDNIATMSFNATRVDHFDECYPSLGAEFPGMIAADLEWSEPIAYRMDFAESGLAKGVFREAKVGPLMGDGSPMPGDEGLYRWKGTILTPTGDYRFLYGSYEVLEGVKSGYLCVFDGAHAFTFSILEALTEDASLAREIQFGVTTGTFNSGNTWNETFTATRLAPGEDFRFNDPFSAVGLVPGETRLNLPQLDDPKYAGKPVIVKVMGTWCPNCHDATRLLIEHYDKYHDQGLEILGLAYEHTTDEVRSKRQIDRFKERLGATWEIIPAGLSDKRQTASTLPALTDIKSYPTTIFLNRDHTVEAIHSGFSGPATGAAHEKTREEFTRLIEKILGS